MSIDALSKNLPITRSNNYQSVKIDSTFVDIYTEVISESEDVDNFDAMNFLQQKYSGLKYHTVDASQFKNWYQLDFPMSKVYQDNIDAQALASWKPTANNTTGFEPHVQADLRKIPRASYAVLIHPDTQSKMDSDPEYAKQIAQKIDNHFQDTIHLNEAVAVGASSGMSQAVYIDENGNVGLQNSITGYDDVFDYVAPETTKTSENKRTTNNESPVQNKDVSNVNVYNFAPSYDYSNIVAEFFHKKK